MNNLLTGIYIICFTAFFIDQNPDVSFKLGALAGCITYAFLFDRKC